MYVPARAYPTWFQNELNKGFMSLYYIVECTLSKDIRTDHEIYEEFLDSLYNISFDTKMDATIFRFTILGLRNKAKELDIAISDDWIARRILKSLKGEYFNITSNYLKGSSSYDLKNFLFAIQIKSPEIARVTSTLKAKVNLNCQTCQSSTHTAVTCPNRVLEHASKPTTAVNKKKSVKKKAKLKAIQITINLIDELLTLRPALQELPLDDVLILDSGAQCSAIKDTGILHDFSPISNSQLFAV
ncbi:hypothetical protein TBLA_0G02020 [Henningerozyma blattae CBS 6284]|uniref:Uncharacterized protein n=1 Tax=Henningerozyma blattae (strain ATCC 34711 / CBS 6284 / DSM 70876 / NBRC 10599 / NRRL Y-10934 / UCD 77-7) TaxID=1071380 RepID=I2H6Z2_HENB6|nr:hypothetical protein TBLA_0G02020 [Tetrapisispora blattae CBS 6284]CCH62144.1 hypothetical protein TBLA_0G02020 [Tetrapisispora blattae CBS 6284]